MSRKSAAQNQMEFVNLAVHLQLLDADRAQDLARSAAAESVAPWQYGLERGELGPADADILRTMLKPRDSVVGYEILGPLGRGGMGVVYHARQLSLDREIALKTILLSQLSNKTAVHRFENEARVMASLAHPNIVTAYDFGQHEGRLFLAMELVRGKDVQRLIKHLGQVPQVLTLHIIRQAACGLAQAAQVGIVHRDIKPANLLLVNPPDGYVLPAGVPLVKIADFGLSTLADSKGDATGRLTSDNVKVGSPVYMAPEQIDCGTATVATDIFSLGATAWHMLVGEPPLSGFQLSLVVAKRLTEPTQPLSSRIPDVDIATSQLIERMLTIDPDKRIGDYEELLREIDQVLAAQQAGIATSSAAWLDLQETSDSVIASASSDTLALTDLFRGAVRSQGEITFGGSRQRFTLKLGVAVALLLFAAFSLFLAGRNWSQPAVRNFDDFGPRISMFDGQTLDGWVPSSGVWSPDRDEEGGRILSGTNGTISYDYSRFIASTASEYYALEASVDCSDSGLPQLHFGFPKAGHASQNADHLVIRVTDTAILAGVAEEDGGFTEQQSVKRVLDRPFLLRVEKQNRDWWILCDGEILGSLPQPSASTQFTFELTANSGTVFFSDITFVPQARDLTMR